MTKSGRKKLVIELQYLGTVYDGWQPQPNQSSVYDVVAAALHKCTGETHGPVVAGRTDKGVHARHQLVSVRTERSHDHEALVAALDPRMFTATAHAVVNRDNCPRLIVVHRKEESGKP